jgi:hypothetical protein
MLEHLDGTQGFANASSGQHEAGRRVASLIEHARADVAATPRPGAALALASQPAAKFERHQQRRLHPETFSEDKS